MVPRLRPGETGAGEVLILKAIEHKRSKGGRGLRCRKNTDCILGSWCGDLVSEQSRTIATKPVAFRSRLGCRTARRRRGRVRL
jgi:hypothetical protein